MPTRCNIIDRSQSTSECNILGQQPYLLHLYLFTKIITVSWSCSISRYKFKFKMESALKPCSKHLFCDAAIVFSSLGLWRRLQHCMMTIARLTLITNQIKMFQSHLWIRGEMEKDDWNDGTLVFLAEWLCRKLATSFESREVKSCIKQVFVLGPSCRCCPPPNVTLACLCDSPSLPLGCSTNSFLYKFYRIVLVMVVEALMHMPGPRAHHLLSLELSLGLRSFPTLHTPIQRQCRPGATEDLHMTPQL